MANVNLQFRAFKLDSAGCRDFLRSAGVRDCVAGYGDRIAATATSMYRGGGRFKCRTKVGKQRCHAFVYTANKRAARSNAKRNTLLKAMYRG